MVYQKTVYIGEDFTTFIKVIKHKQFDSKGCFSYSRFACYQGNSSHLYPFLPKLNLDRVLKVTTKASMPNIMFKTTPPPAI